MERRGLGQTGLETAPIVFGGNVFGWTVDEPTSFKLLDQFVEAGFNAIDTADVYSAWADGNKGGESETIIGNWLKATPSRRDQVLIFTKVGSDMGEEGKKGLSAKWIEQAVEDSLRRLQTDRIDVYLSHWPDESVTYEETLGAYQKLIDAGKVRAIGVSNVNAAQLAKALDTARAHNLSTYQVLQPHYNLYDRETYETALRDLAITDKLGVITYFSLASGFLTGKYRTEADVKGSRAEAVGKYMNGRGMRILEALDDMAKKHDAKPAEVALAWLMHKDGVTAPIASATSSSQIDSFIRATEIELSHNDVHTLDKSSL